MSDFSKRNKTKKVVFSKDFYGIYKKGSTHYIHEDTVEAKSLKDFGKVSDVDFKEEYRKAAAFAKKQKAKQAE